MPLSRKFEIQVPVSKISTLIEVIGKIDINPPRFKWDARGPKMAPGSYKWNEERLLMAVSHNKTQCAIPPIYFIFENEQDCLLVKIAVGL